MDEARTFRCEIFTGEATVLITEAEAVRLPATDGLIGVLPRRAPLAAALGKGEMTVRTPQGTVQYKIKGGVAHMRDNVLTILAEECAPVARTA